MADELVYAHLNLPSEPNCASPLRRVQVFNNSQGSRWPRIALWIGWIGNIILLVIVILLVFQVTQSMTSLEQTAFMNGTGNSYCETENKSSLENFKSHLRQLLCKPLDSNSAEDSRCKLCPEKWFRFQSKCYWISKRKQTWSKSKEDCQEKHAQMLVIQKQEEVAFIQSIVEGAQLVWIGLAATFPEKKWIWVDGSSLDDKLFQGLGPAETNSCGMLNGNASVPGGCSSVNPWICETEALDISNKM